MCAFGKKRNQLRKIFVVILVLIRTNLEAGEITMSCRKTNFVGFFNHLQLYRKEVGSLHCGFFYQENAIFELDLRVSDGDSTLLPFLMKRKPVDDLQMINFLNSHSFWLHAYQKGPQLCYFVCSLTANVAHNRTIVVV